MNLLLQILDAEFVATPNETVLEVQIPMELGTVRPRMAPSSLKIFSLGVDHYTCLVFSIQCLPRPTEP